MKTIADMQIGHRGRVAQVDGNDSLAARIMEMGLVPGTEVEMIGVAPLGDPLELLIRGYRLSLRRSEAKRVALEDDSSN
ncbi:MAG: ferrous iron transport protein A [Planctomycetales bacterium]|nr:ferrous iron transport protein A [Planctomycetales bacterium]MCA9205459.1 ferrous iron transport protein A [Planctomycetales bacterium]MCA9211100.1 ferrous iron transport protein A [Planctomycetales bacterium]MCA9223905.1 ferrous iron transport protein A [Planctomycetales bacterium]MCA9227621.1 ferrous iron transport protein A [Planctomycetales bacterium]